MSFTEYLFYLQEDQQQENKSAMQAKLLHAIYFEYQIDDDLGLAGYYPQKL